MSFVTVQISNKKLAIVVLTKSDKYQIFCINTRFNWCKIPYLWWIYCRHGKFIAYKISKVLQKQHHYSLFRPCLLHRLEALQVRGCNLFDANIYSTYKSLVGIFTYHKDREKGIINTTLSYDIQILHNNGMLLGFGVFQLMWSVINS